MEDLTVTVHTGTAYTPAEVADIMRSRVDSDHTSALEYDAFWNRVRMTQKELDRAREKVLRSGMTVAALIDALSTLPPGAFVLQSDADSARVVRSVRVRGAFVDLSEER